MTDHDQITCTLFEGARRVASGPRAEVARAALRALDAGADGPVLVWDDATGRLVDIDPRGDSPAAEAPAEPEAPVRQRGRPKLGVVAREVTLLPRHWEWLRAQSGGASVALRKLVEEARRQGAGRDQVRARREAAYRFLAAMAGDLPGYEDALRALFAGDRARFDAQSGSWPKDVRDYGLKLAEGSWQVGGAT